MKKINRLINYVKSKNHICIPVYVAEALIKTLNKPDYEEYYFIRYSGDEYEYDGNVYIKIKDKYKLFVFRILIHKPTNYACISYDYGVNDSVDRILLKWLCDLLSDGNYIKDELKKYEKILQEDLKECENNVI